MRRRFSLEVGQDVAVGYSWVRKDFLQHYISLLEIDDLNTLPLTMFALEDRVLTALYKELLNWAETLKRDASIFDVVAYVKSSSAI